MNRAGHDICTVVYLVVCIIFMYVDKLTLFHDSVYDVQVEKLTICINMFGYEGTCVRLLQVAEDAQAAINLYPHKFCSSTDDHIATGTYAFVP